AAVEVRGVKLVPGPGEVWSAGRPVEITTTEFDILELIVRAAGRIISRAELSAAIYRRPASPHDRSLDVHVSHLRKKLGPLGGLIRTIRGVGSLLCAELVERHGTRASSSPAVRRRVGGVCPPHPRCAAAGHT